jgi:hypothetical protein
MTIIIKSCQIYWILKEYSSFQHWNIVGNVKFFELQKLLSLWNFYQIVKVYQNSNFVKIAKFCKNYEILSKLQNFVKLHNFFYQNEEIYQNCRILFKLQKFVKIVIFFKNYEIINIQKFCQNLKLFQSKSWIVSGFYNIVINVKFS